MMSRSMNKALVVRRTKNAIKASRIVQKLRVAHVLVAMIVDYAVEFIVGFYVMTSYSVLKIEK